MSMHANIQDVFNTVVTHLRKQNARSFSSALDGCMYRAPDGKMCAVGCLISDEHYTPEIEGKNLINMDVQRVVENSIGQITANEMNLLRNLQRIHDYNPVDEWENQFDRIATKFNLTLPSNETANS